MLLEILVGIALAIVFVLLARMRGGRGERALLAVGLVVAALVYVGFASAGQVEARWHFTEAVGLLVFGVLAWWGLRREPIWLAVGWALHVGWDLGLHGGLPGAAQPFVPTWYPALCVGFDIFVAGYILGRQASGWASTSQKSPATGP